MPGPVQPSESRRAARVPLALAWSLLALPLAGEIFVHIPGVPGDVTVEGYDNGNWTKARSGSYGADRDLVDFAKGGAEAINIGIGELTPLGLVFDLNQAAAPLLQASINGNTIGDIEIHLVDLGEEPVTFGVIRLKRAFVKDFETAGPADERPWFQAFLIYSEIEVTNRLNMREQVSTWDLVRLTGSYHEGGVVNEPPGIPPIADQALVEDGTLLVPFLVSDPDGPVDALTTTAASSNPALVPNSGLVTGGEGPNRTLNIEPAPNANGSAVVTVVVSDGSASASSDFTVTVSPSPDPPAIGEVEPQLTEVDTALTLPLFVSDPDQPADGLRLQARSTDRSLVPDDGLSIEYDGVRWMLTITPAAGRAGSAEIQLIVEDEIGLQAATAFLLTVNSPENSAPSEILLDPGVVPEDAPAGTMVGILSAIDPDGDVEFEFTLVDDDTGNFILEEGVRILTSAAARFDYETRPRHGIRVRARDPAGAILEQVVEVEVENVNEPPVVAIELPPSVPNSPAGAPSPVPIRYPALDISDPDAGAGDVTVGFAVVHGTLFLEDSGVLFGKVLENESAMVGVVAPLGDLRAVLAAGGLLYRPAPGYDGIEQLTVLVDDNGHSGSGGARQAGASEAFRVTPAPSWDWLHEFFTVEEIDNPDIGGLFADYDRDRLEGIFEFKLARNPRDPTDGGSGVELREVMVESRPHWELSFVQRSDESTPHTRLEVEVATGAGEWLTGAGVVQLVSRTPLGDELERLVFRLTRARSEEPRQFIRLCAIYSGPSL